MTYATLTDKPLIDVLLTLPQIRAHEVGEHNKIGDIVKRISEKLRNKYVPYKYDLWPVRDIDKWDCSQFKNFGEYITYFANALYYQVPITLSVNLTWIIPIVFDHMDEFKVSLCSNHFTFEN